MIGNRELTLDDYLAILRRRRWLIVVPALLGPVIGFLISLALPARYTSTTLVLVEQQKVPENYVRSVIGEQLSQRLATMQEQILSRTRLQPVIEKFDLYKEDRNRVPMEDLVARLRKSINVAAVRTLAGTQPESGVPGFAISFTADNPRVAQQVCADITSMFMEENLRVREQRAEGTTEFLSKQLAEAKRKLDEQDARLAAFKQRYTGQLPGQEETNLNMLMGLNTQMQVVSQTISRAQQDKTYLESMLTQHLAAWEASKVSNDPENLEKQLANQQTLLVALEARYTPNHPDVIKTKNDIVQLKKKIDQAGAAAADKPAAGAQKAKGLEPPQIQQFRNQIHLAEEIIREKTGEQERLQNEIKNYQARIQLSPVVEQQYKEITRDYQTALDFHHNLLAKKTESEMSTDLERRQQGEQFRVMDPANLPERPSFPNRPLFTLGGLGGGLALGLGLALVLEMGDKSLRNERDVQAFLKLPTLALLPTIESGNGGQKRFWRRGKKPAAELEIAIER
jgi:polysaccharide chain length determinant protein (PEP-CTERM system associated)